MIIIKAIDKLIKALDRFQYRWARRISDIQDILLSWKRDIMCVRRKLGHEQPVYTPPWLKLISSAELNNQWLNFLEGRQRNSLPPDVEVIGKGNGEVEIVRPPVRYRRYQKLPFGDPKHKEPGCPAESSSE